jgi:lysophospholipase L1-like esterase
MFFDRSPKLRIAGAVLLSALALSTTACSKLGFGEDDGPTSPSGPPAAGSALIYAAIGASDVTGVGASRPCLSGFLDCPDSTGYVFAAARQLRGQGFTVTVTNLGFPGAVVSPRFEALGRQYGRNDILANFVEDLAPFVRAETTHVTIFAGGNDVNVITTALGGGAGANNPNAFVDQQVQAFGDDFSTLVAEVRRRASSARLVLLNLPNLGGLPYLAAASAAQRRAAQRASVGMTAAINRFASQNTRVVDLMCDTRLYQRANLHTDGFHPNDAGYAIMASAVVNAVTAATFPAPAASCGQMTLVE